MIRILADQVRAIKWDSINPQKLTVPLFQHAGGRHRWPGGGGGGGHGVPADPHVRQVQQEPRRPDQGGGQEAEGRGEDEEEGAQEEETGAQVSIGIRLSIALFVPCTLLVYRTLSDDITIHRINSILNGPVFINRFCD